MSSSVPAVPPLPAPPADNGAREIDWPSVWFPIMARLGEATDIVMARIDESGLPHWRVFPHAENDGVGVMRDLLLGPGTKDDDLPRLRDARAPSAFRTLIAIARYAWMVHRQRTQWTRYDPTRVGASPAAAWCVFEPADSALLEEYARAQKVSINTLLLLTLDRAVRRNLIRGGVTRWAIPVNMRGAPGLSAQSVNQFSAIHVLVTSHTGLAQLHARVRDKFREGNHWANWALMHAGKLIGLKRAEQFFVDGYRNPHPGTGALSNVADWKSDRIGPRDGWVALSMVSKISPIGGCTLSVNGRRSLSLQLHPSLGAGAEEIAETLRAWIHELASCLSRPLPDKLSIVEASEWQKHR